MAAERTTGAGDDNERGLDHGGDSDGFTLRLLYPNEPEVDKRAA